MGMEEDLGVGSLQPWQIFSALYLGFWSLSAYFDHFLMTFVFCLAFGVMSEIATRYMNGDHLASPASAKEMEASRMAVSRAEQSPPPVQQQQTPSKDDLKEELPGEDDGPPPLPAKDYLPAPEEIMEATQQESNACSVSSTSFNVNDPFLEAARASTEHQPTEAATSTSSRRLSEAELTGDDSIKGVMASSTYVNIDSSQDNLDDFSTKEDFEDSLVDTASDAKNDDKDTSNDTTDPDKKDEQNQDDFIESHKNLVTVEEPLIDAKDSFLDFKDDLIVDKDPLVDTTQPLVDPMDDFNDSFKMSEDPLVTTKECLMDLPEPSVGKTETLKEESVGDLANPVERKDFTADGNLSKKSMNESFFDDFSAPPSKEPSPPLLPTSVTSSTTHNLLQDFDPSPAAVVQPADSSNSLLEDFGGPTVNDSLGISDLSVGRSGHDVEVVGAIEDAMNVDDDAYVNKSKDGKVYAPDSSSDEELEAEYANREVNLDESESEEENGGYEFQRGGAQDSSPHQKNGGGYEFKHGISPGLDDSSPEEGPQDHLSSEDSSPAISSVQDHDNTAVTSTGPAVTSSGQAITSSGQDESAAVTSSAQEADSSEMKGGATGAKAFLLGDDTSTQHSNSEIDDIDLTDPELQVAATKIQSVFKGFQARKKMSNL